MSTAHRFHLSTLFVTLLLLSVLLFIPFTAIAGGGGGGGGGGDATEGNISDATGGVEGSTGPGTGTGPAAGTTGPGDVGVQGPDEGVVGAIGNAIGAVFGAVGQAIGVVASVAIDVVAGVAGNAASVAATGMSAGHAATNISTPTSAAIEAVLGAVFGDSSSPPGSDGPNVAGTDTGGAVGSSGSPGPGNSNSGPDNSNAGGGVNTIFGSAPLAPSISFQASAEQVTKGESVALVWRVSNASSCSARDSWGGAKGLSGEEIIANLDQNKVYTLSCRGADGSLCARSVFVTVLDPDVGTPIPFPDQEGNLPEGTAGSGGSGSSGGVVKNPLPDPTLTLTAEPPFVQYGQPLTLRWRSENALVCVGADDWPVGQAEIGSERNYENTSGQKTVFFQTHDKRFTLACYGPDGRVVQKSVEITVSSNVIETGP